MIRIQEDDFDLGHELSRMRANRTEIGAIASFVGLMRDLNDGDNVTRMRLEHYPGMTEQSIEETVTHASERWPLIDVTVIHRVGELSPGDQIVLVAVASRHRGAAFEACEFVMDFLKTRAPIWKKEHVIDGTSRWVNSRSSDDEAALRWQKNHPDASS
jgi:molybdopterin synthase catalytic subunit